MKLVMTTFTTTVIPNFDIDMSILQSKKGLNVIGGGSGSSTIKPIGTSEPKGKGKVVHVKPIAEKKRRFKSWSLIQ